MPALPLGEAGKYVAAAYLVVFALVLAYVAIMAIRLSRLERELFELNELAERGEEREATASAASAPAPADEEVAAGTTRTGASTLGTRAGVVE